MRNTGLSKVHRSLATTAAIHLARITTGRDKVMKFGCTGWHDRSVPVAVGIPPKARDDILPLEYNNIAQAEETLEKFKGSVAAEGFTEGGEASA